MRWVFCLPAVLIHPPAQVRCKPSATALGLLLPWLSDAAHQRKCAAYPAQKRCVFCFPYCRKCAGASASALRTGAFALLLLLPGPNGCCHQRKCAAKWRLCATASASLGRRGAGALGTGAFSLRFLVSVSSLAHLRLFHNAKALLALPNSKNLPPQVPYLLQTILLPMKT